MAALDLALEGPASAEDGIFGLDVSPDDARVILVPVPTDATVSYGRGTRHGPRAILEASPQLDLWDRDAGSSEPPLIAMLEADREIRKLDDEARRLVDSLRAAGYPERSAELPAANEIGTELGKRVYDQITPWLERGQLVGVVGGDHSAAFGSIAAHLETYPEMGILQIDAHADLRQAYEGLLWSHASVMYNALTCLGAPRLV